MGIIALRDFKYSKNGVCVLDIKSGDDVSKIINTKHYKKLLKTKMIEMVEEKKVTKTKNVLKNDTEKDIL